MIGEPTACARCEAIRLSLAQWEMAKHAYLERARRADIREMAEHYVEQSLQCKLVCGVLRKLLETDND